MARKVAPARRLTPEEIQCRKKVSKDAAKILKMLSDVEDDIKAIKRLLKKI